MSTFTYTTKGSIVGSVESIGTLLIASCRGAHASVVARARELLSLSFSPPEIEQLRKMALRAAVKHNNGNIIRILLDCGFVMEAHEIAEAFATACESGNASTLLALLDSGICTMIDDTQYCTALKEAAKGGYSDVIRLLYRQNSSRYSHEILEQTFLVSCGQGLTDVAQEMLGEVKRSPSQHIALILALNIACSNGHEKTVAFLIQEGANLNAVEAVTPHLLFQEAFADADSIFDLTALIQAEGIGRPPLQWALSGFGLQLWYPWMPCIGGRRTSLTEREAIIYLLLGKNAKVNMSAELQDYPIHTAIKCAPPNVLRAMVAEGAKFHSPAERWMFSHSLDKRKMSIFEMAATREVEGAEIIEILVDAGAMAVMNTSDIESALNQALKFFGGTDPRSRQTEDAGNFLSSTSIKGILERGPGAVVRALLSYLPHLKAEDVGYGLLLQMAARAGDRGCMEVLLRHHVDVNASGYYYGTALQAASRVGNIDIVQMLLDAHADINVLQGKYGTAFRAAVKGEHLFVAESLLRQGADVNLCSQKGYGPTEDSQPILHLAIHQGNDAIAGMLLANGADVNAPDNASWGNEYIHDKEASPLHVACDKGYRSLAAMLLAHGADIEKRVGKFRSPLQLAASAGHFSVAQLLIKAGANLDSFADKNQGTALSIASGNGHRKVATALIKAGASIGGSPDMPNALAAACRQHHRTIAEYMLEELFGTEHEESICREALAAACADRDDKTTQMLLERVKPWSSATLHQVCAAGLEDCLTMMLEKGVNVHDVDDNGGHAIHTAASHLQSGIVRLLIEHGADVNVQNSYYGSPLIAALEGCLAPLIQDKPGYGWLKLIKTLPRGEVVRIYRQRNHIYNHNDVVQCRLIVQSLLGQRADVTEEMRVFGAAIHLASFIGDDEVVRLLIVKGSNVNSIGGYFETPLLAAVAGRNITITKLLLNSGAKINYVSSEHATALHLACSHDLKPIVRALIDHGADVNAQIDHHGTPLSVALLYDIRNEGCWNRESLTRVLLACGRKIEIQESDLKAAATQRTRRLRTGTDNYFELLLEYDPSMEPPSGNIVNAVVASPIGLAGAASKVLKLLVEHHGSILVTEDMLRTVHDPEVLGFLLQERLTFQITPEILEAAAAKEFTGRRLLQLMIDYAFDIPVTESTILTALRAGLPKATRQMASLSGATKKLVQSLLERNSNLAITDGMLRSAYYYEDMQSLLKHGSEKSVPQDVLDAASSDGSMSKDLIPLLLGHDPSLRICPSLITRAMLNCYGMVPPLEVLLNHDPDLVITEEAILSAVTANQRDERKRHVAEVLLAHGRKIDFKENVRSAIDRCMGYHNQKQLRSLWYSLEKHAL